MTISSISSLSPQTQSLQSTSSSSSGSSTSSLGEQLLAEVAQAQASSGSATDPLQQTLVSLGLGSGSSSVSTTPLTYNAKGLLNQIQTSLMLNDPLLQTSDSSSADSGNDPTSLLNSLLATGQGTSAAAASGTPGTASGTATPGPNINWAQILQKDPSMAAAFAESQMNQGILGMLP